ncbi:hypothetical protein D5086_010355 [Populus alba]|uniref:Uncharacterized protein n=1 Tax=Populus alba TaxID=43335 RepID=A0ACC4CAE1_POPAL
MQSVTMALYSFSLHLSLLLFFILSSARVSKADFELTQDVISRQEADRVVRLPGQPEVTFKQYAGYVTVNESHGRALFYWFFEAIENPEEKPLLLWLNGGPGCSSIGYGEAEELGPFFPKRGGQELQFNPHTWNNVANLLFLESPVGVGFSYSNTTSDLRELGDKSYREAMQVLIHCSLSNSSCDGDRLKIRIFSFSQGTMFHSLRRSSMTATEKASKKEHMNLKGFIIGNAILDDETDQKGTIDYAWDHATISDGVYNSIKKNCDFISNLTEECWDSLLKYYNVYKIINDILRRIPAGYDPCTMNATDYFNLPDVQAALHANAIQDADRVTELPGQTLVKFQQYSRFVAIDENYGKALFYWFFEATQKPEKKPLLLRLNGDNRSLDVQGDNLVLQMLARQDSATSILPVIKKLINGGIRVWVFSGDTDGRVPVTSTRYTLNKLGLNITEDWTPWYNHREVGGWTNYTFITVRGAGHQVPSYAPKRALQLVRHFLANKKLPSVAF